MSKAETLAYDLEAEVITHEVADKAAAELRRLAPSSAKQPLSTHECATTQPHTHTPQASCAERTPMNTTETDVIPQVCNEKAMCSSLLNRLEDGRRKGFEALHTTNLETDEERFLGVVYRTSVKDRGLMLNWCPFCGGQPGYFERE